MKGATKVLCGLGLGALLLAPAVIAFFQGGYFDEQRLVAGIAAWVVVIVAAVASPRPLPARWPARLALGGLALLTAVVGLSITWAPLKGPALADFERMLLYLAVAVGAAAFLAWRRLAPLVEPALAVGAVVVIGYALSDRTLPSVVKQSHSASAGGRLEQPLTYWNAVGALAAIGLVLCARLAGDVRRPLALRAAAAASAAPLGAGLYLSFSRGALAAAAAGLVALALLAPGRPQLRSIGAALAAAVVASLPAAVALDAVRSLEGGDRDKQGLVFLVVLLGAMAAAALAQIVMARREAAGRLRSDPIRLPGRAIAIAAAVAVIAAGALVAAASKEGPRATRSPDFGATTSRLQSVESNRYAYWKVALRVFADHPLKGDGARSFQADWIEQRKIADPAKDAHSLYLETAAELGLIGLLALGLFLGGTAATAVRARRIDAAVAAGPVAAVCVWLVHAGLDWDWEMPAVTLIPLVLIGSLVAAVDAEPAGASGGAGTAAATRGRGPLGEQEPPPPPVPAAAPADA